MNLPDRQGHYVEPILPQNNIVFHQRAKPWSPLPNDGPNYMTAMIPIRMFAYIMNFVLIGSSVYLVALGHQEVSELTLVLMVAVSMVYMVFGTIHIIGYFASIDTIEKPMICCSFIGIFIYTFVGGMIVVAKRSVSWVKMYSFVICFIIAITLTVDVILALVYFRSKYTSRNELVPNMENNGDLQVT